MIKEIELVNFRCYNKSSFIIKENKVIIIGKNAVGKTSILESIYLASIAKSFRTNNYKEMIQEGKDYSKVTVKEDSTYEVILSSKGKKVLKNGLEMPKLSDYIGNLLAVFFSPNDLEIIYGSPLKRRQYINIYLSQISKKYLLLMNEFREVLKERNEFLHSQTIDPIFLKVINEKIFEVNNAIVEFRKLFVDLVNKRINLIHQEFCPNEELSIIYSPSVTKENIEEVFKAKQDYDILSKTTNYGIHRDEFLFKINGNLAASFASQGQVRSFILSLKLATLEIIKEKRKRDVVLILDDVLSELDSDRQIALIRYLDMVPQVFISTTSINAIPENMLKKVQIIRLGCE